MVDPMTGTITSNVEAKLLDASQLPEYAAHHTAKHALLDTYMGAWLPKLGFTNPRVAILDGFASAGRYRDGTAGSPLVLLRAYTTRADCDSFRSPPQFTFIESKRNFAEHLLAEVELLPDLKGAHVEVIHARYEDHFPVVIDQLASAYPNGLPVFAFIDPRGYKETPFELIRTYRKRLGAKAEAMVYLPVSFMARFLMTDLTENALIRALDGTDVVQRVREDPDLLDNEAGERIAGAFAELMSEQHGYVTQFTVDPVRHNEYHLFFGTGSTAGVREMKRAYWKVDPIAGTGYQQDPLLALGQGNLFSAAHTGELAHEDTLPVLLRAHFGTAEFTVREAEEWTLLQTRFLDKPHLRKLALIPLWRAGKLQALGPSRRRDSDFPPATKLRLTI